MSAAGARRVGLFGGSFDPIHEGHLHAARAAQRAFGLERVLFVPASRSPFKTGGRGPVPAPAADRLAMVELAIRDEPTWEASTLELEREGPSYTIDTVRALRARLAAPEQAELFLILGSDQLPLLPGWREVDELLSSARPIVIWREGDPEALLADLRGKLGPELLEGLRAGFLREPPVRVSSSELRSGRLRVGGVERRVPAAVLEYARSRGLYGG